MAAKKETKIEKAARLKTAKEIEAKRLREEADALQIAVNKTALLAALEVTRGLVATACKAVNLSRTTFYNYYNDDSEFAEKVDEINEIELDKVESKMLSRIDGGSDLMMIFYMKCKGKKRGFIEKEPEEKEDNSNDSYVAHMPSNGREIK